MNTDHEKKLRELARPNTVKMRHLREAYDLGLAAAKEWREAVLNELIVAHIYTKEHETNPRKAIQDAITWHCQVALDPNVSSDARKLIEAAEARAEENARDAERYRQRRVLAKHCGVAEVKREWHTIAEWLYPGDEICLIDAAIAEGKK